MPMFQQPFSKVAVALLAPSVQPGAAPVPMRGYCLVSGTEPGARVTVYLEPGMVWEGNLVWVEQQVASQAPPPEAEPEPVPKPEPEPEPEAEAVAEEEPAVVGFKLVPEPATPVAVVAPPTTLTVPLSSQHPMAPRAAGTASLDLREGALTLTLRGLPSPAGLGRDAGSARPLNAYRAWLVNRRAGARHDLGLLSRVWGENFRLQSEAGLPLQRFDSIQITADDRSLEVSQQGAPLVAAGDYQPV